MKLKYNKDYPNRVRAFAGKGYTKLRMIEKLGISSTLFYLWIERYPEFKDAVTSVTTYSPRIKPGNPRRQSKYRPELPRIVRELAGQNYSKIAIARFLKISPMTLYKWAEKHSAFREAIELAVKDTPQGLPARRYKPEFAAQAEKLAAEGYNISEITRSFHIMPKTFRIWCRENPEFMEAIERGRLAAAPKRQPGRWTVPFNTPVTEEMIVRAVDILQRGGTYSRVAEELGVSLAQLREWEKKNEEFAAALTTGKIRAQGAVEGATFRRAVGYKYVETTRETVQDGEGAIVRQLTRETEKHLPGDIRAQETYLKKNDPEGWGKAIGGNTDTSVEVGIHQLLTPAVEAGLQRVAAYLATKKTNNRTDNDDLNE